MNVITCFDIETGGICYIATLDDNQYNIVVSFLECDDANFGHFRILYKTIIKQKSKSIGIISNLSFDYSKWKCSPNMEEYKFIPTTIDGHPIKIHRYFAFDSANY
jgi:hypothetical protein